MVVTCHPQNENTNLKKCKNYLFFSGATSIGGRERGDSSEAEVASVRQQEYRALGEEQTASGFSFDDNDDFEMLILVQAGMC